MIAITAAARQAKPANVNADGLPRIPRCLLDHFYWDTSFVLEFTLLKTCKNNLLGTLDPWINHIFSIIVLLRLCENPITPGSKVAEQLKFKEKRQSYIKDYKKSEIARKRRSTLRYNKYNLYDSKRKDKPDYQRQLLDSQVTISDTVVSNVNTRCQHLTDHNYTKFLFWLMLFTWNKCLKYAQWVMIFCTESLVKTMLSFNICNLFFENQMCGIYT